MAAEDAKTKILFTSWFDIQDEEHAKAAVYLYNTNRFPEDFIPDNVVLSSTIDAMLDHIIQQMAYQFATEKLLAFSGLPTDEKDLRTAAEAAVIMNPELVEDLYA